MHMNRQITVGVAVLLMAILSANCAKQESAQISDANNELPIVESILHGGSRQRHAEVGLKAKRGGRDLAIGVLDVLRLVQDQRVPALRGQPVRVEPQDGVGREREVGSGIERASRSMVDAAARARAWRREW